MASKAVKVNLRQHNAMQWTASPSRPRLGRRCVSSKDFKSGKNEVIRSRSQRDVNHQFSPFSFPDDAFTMDEYSQPSTNETEFSSLPSLPLVEASISNDEGAVSEEARDVQRRHGQSYGFDNSRNGSGSNGEFIKKQYHRPISKSFCVNRDQNQQWPIDTSNNGYTTNKKDAHRRISLQLESVKDQKPQNNPRLAIQSRKSFNARPSNQSIFSVVYAAAKFKGSIGSTKKENSKRTTKPIETPKFHKEEQQQRNANSTSKRTTKPIETPKIHKEEQQQRNANSTPAPTLGRKKRVSSKSLVSKTKRILSDDSLSRVVSSLFDGIDGPQSFPRCASATADNSDRRSRSYQSIENCGSSRHSRSYNNIDNISRSRHNRSYNRIDSRSSIHNRTWNHIDSSSSRHNSSWDHIDNNSSSNNHTSNSNHSGSGLSNSKKERRHHSSQDHIDSSSSRHNSSWDHVDYNGSHNHTWNSNHSCSSLSKSKKERSLHANQDHHDIKSKASSNISNGKIGRRNCSNQLSLKLGSYNKNKKNKLRSSMSLDGFADVIRTSYGIQNKKCTQNQNFYHFSDNSDSGKQYTGKQNKQLNTPTTSSHHASSEDTLLHLHITPTRCTEPKVEQRGILRQSVSTDAALLPSPPLFGYKSSKDTSHKLQRASPTYPESKKADKKASSSSSRLKLVVRDNASSHQDSSSCENSQRPSIYRNDYPQKTTAPNTTATNPNLPSPLFDISEYPEAPDSPTPMVDVLEEVRRWANAQDIIVD